MLDNFDVKIIYYYKYNLYLKNNKYMWDTVEDQSLPIDPKPPYSFSRWENNRIVWREWIRGNISTILATKKAAKNPIKLNRLTELARQDERRSLWNDILSHVVWEQLPHEYEAEYNILMIWNLSIKEYEKAQKIWFTKYREQYCDRITQKEDELLRVEMAGRKFDNLVIVTTMKYPDNDPNTPLYRRDLALKFFDKIGKLGIKCIVWDWWSWHEFLSKIRTYPNVEIVPIEKSSWFGPDRSQIVNYAVSKYPGEYYLQTEPEKQDFWSVRNLCALLKSIRSGENHIVLAKREDKISMPDFHAREETGSNKALKDIIEPVEFDNNKSGPADLYGWDRYDFFWSATICDEIWIKYFTEYKSKMDIRDRVILPIIEAHRKGENIGTCPVDITYDRREKYHEQMEPWKTIFRNKRLKQRVRIKKEANNQTKKYEIMNELKGLLGKDINVSIEKEGWKWREWSDCIFSINVDSKDANNKELLDWMQMKNREQEQIRSKHLDIVEAKSNERNAVGKAERTISKKYIDVYRLNIQDKEMNW